LFPFIDTAPRASRPLIVLGLIVINTLVFIWLRSLSRTELDEMLGQYALIPVRYTDPEVAREAGLDPSDWWPLVTDMFMHGGWIHLISNMWFLWIFGPAMEARFGRLGFAVLFLIGGVFANVVHLATHPQSADPVLGASGAIAAVIAAYAVIYPSARVLTIVPIGFIPLFFRIPAMVFAVIWFALQLIQGSIELATPSMAGDVAVWAHIGGFAFGVAFAVIGARVMPGLQTPAIVWKDTRGGRVPNIRARSYFSSENERSRGPWE
jgi:membrane associated rhomboid family serine protease